MVEMIHIYTYVCLYYTACSVGYTSNIRKALSVSLSRIYDHHTYMCLHRLLHPPPPVSLQ